MVRSRPETEAGFLTAVVELAHLYGWKVYHQRSALTHRGWRTTLQGDAGFPDLVLARPPRVLVAECKSARGRLRVEQRAWVQVLGQCPGVECYIWRPEHWDLISRLLAREGTTCRRG
jgi:hypothetical protein